jgi:hypothetical protein
LTVASVVLFRVLLFFVILHFGTLLATILFRIDRLFSAKTSNPAPGGRGIVLEALHETLGEASDQNPVPETVSAGSKTPYCARKGVDLAPPVSLA